MTKLMYNGEEIDFDDEIETSEKEIDTMDGFPEFNNLEDTLEMKFPNSLEDTLEMEKISLEDTAELNLGVDEDE